LKFETLSVYDKPAYIKFASAVLLYLYFAVTAPLERILVGCDETTHRPHRPHRQEITAPAPKTTTNPNPNPKTASNRLQLPPCSKWSF